MRIPDLQRRRRRGSRLRVGWSLLLEPPEVEAPYTLGFLAHH